MSCPQQPENFDIKKEKKEKKKDIPTQPATLSTAVSFIHRRLVMATNNQIICTIFFQKFLKSTYGEMRCLMKQRATMLAHNIALVPIHMQKQHTTKNILDVSIDTVAHCRCRCGRSNTGSRQKKEHQQFIANSISHISKRLSSTHPKAGRKIIPIPLTTTSRTIGKCRRKLILA